MPKLLPEQLQAFLHVALSAAKAGGGVLKKYWGKISRIKEKSYSGDLVTEADQESEELIIATIRAAYPEHAILAEESGAHSGKESSFVWAIDPLDGTTNYTHQFPMVSVSIGLLYQDQPIVGVVYNPIFNELFQAVEGGGAHCNGLEIKVSSTGNLANSLLVTGFPYNRREIPLSNYNQFVHLTQITQGVRRIGSAALDLAYVAAGRLDGYWEKGLKPWDMAAGIILVREAGGIVSSTDLSTFELAKSDLLASNGSIHNQLSHELCIGI